jgi:hypothetical protein
MRAKWLIPRPFSAARICAYRIIEKLGGQRDEASEVGDANRH